MSYLIDIAIREFLLVVIYLDISFNLMSTDTSNRRAKNHFKIKSVNDVSTILFMVSSTLKIILLNACFCLPYDSS